MILLLVGLLFHQEIGHFFFPFQYRELIEDQASLVGIDPRLVAALIYVESDFNPRAVSKKGARGLMQIMPETASWIAEKRGEGFHSEQLYHPRENLMMGIWYLNWLYQEFSGDTALVLAAYNAGWVRVKEWKKDRIWGGEVKELHRIPYKETRRYVTRVFRVYHIYQYLYT